jgi:N-acetylglucosaminyl-diphospho-decaprenol L-rhamnosyltransferase
VRPRVAAIVVNFNSGRILGRAIASLLDSTYPNLEVVVFDNASAVDFGDVLATPPPRVRVMRNSENLGFGRACNAAARSVTADYLVFLNPDVVVTNGWLEPLVEAFERDSRLAVASPSTLHADEPLPSRSGIEPTATVPGCALMVRRAAWEELRGFDESFFLYWEDTDLCWRTWNSGGRVVESFDSVVYHERGGSSGAQNWAHEQIRNGIRTHLKNMRWRVVLPFLARSLVRTVLEVARSRSSAAFGAWIWNGRNLTATLRERRRIQATRSIDPRVLEDLAASHRARQLRERQARKPVRSSPAKPSRT